MPAVMNAANEAAVGSFLKNEIAFGEIAEVVKKVMAGRNNIKKPKLEQILKADFDARALAREYIEKN